MVYLESSTVSESVRLRLITGPERERLRRQLPAVHPSLVDRCDCLAIEHKVGVGYVVAAMMFIHWQGEPGASGVFVCRQVREGCRLSSTRPGCRNQSRQQIR
jgi:hypothetical protein